MAISGPSLGFTKVRWVHFSVTVQTVHYYQKFPNSRTGKTGQTLGEQVQQIFQDAGPNVRDTSADLSFGPAILQQCRTDYPAWFSEFS